MEGGEPAMRRLATRDTKHNLMTLDELISEGEALVRPCFLLMSSPSLRFGGFFGGERHDRPNIVPREATALASLRHIITIDSALPAELGLPTTAPLSLFVAEDIRGNESHRVEQPAIPRFEEISCTGTRLYAVPAQSFPPIEAVCLYGSTQVAEWMRELGLARHQYGDVTRSPIARQYMDEFTRRAPLYSGEADAIVGGWHMMWPEDDFFMPIEMRLVLTTIRDSEPFYEIWVTDSAVRNYSVQSRIT
jgi:hypothetical protein